MILGCECQRNERVNKQNKQTDDRWFFKTCNFKTCTFSHLLFPVFNHEPSEQISLLNFGEWTFSHAAHDLRRGMYLILLYSSSILPVKNLFHKLYRFWECPFCSPLYLSAFLVLALWSLRPRWVLGTLKSPSLGLSCSHQMDAAGLTTHSHLP